MASKLLSKPIVRLEVSQLPDGSVRAVRGGNSTLMLLVTCLPLAVFGGLVTYLKRSDFWPVIVLDAFIGSCLLLIVAVAFRRTFVSVSASGMKAVNSWPLWISFGTELAWQDVEAVAYVDDGSSVISPSHVEFTLADGHKVKADTVLVDLLLADERARRTIPESLLTKLKGLQRISGEPEDAGPSGGAHRGQVE